MASEQELREQLATCTRIFAMQGMIGVFGHVSVFQPERKTVFDHAGLGSDKGNFRHRTWSPRDLDGKQRRGTNARRWSGRFTRRCMAARSDALAVAHLHTPYATLFAIAKREFHPVTLQGTIFGDGVPLYKEAHLVTTPAARRRHAENHRRQSCLAHARPRHRRRWQKLAGSVCLHR